MKSEFLPIRNNATPTMDIYATQKMLYRCTETEFSTKKKCEKCKYYKTTDCKDRLMLEAAHALTLLLDERDKGAALIIGEDE